MVSSICLGLFIINLRSYEFNLTSEIYEILVTYFINYVNSKVPSGYYFSIKDLWYNVNILKYKKYLDYMNYIIKDMDWFDYTKYRTMYKDVLHNNKQLIIHKKPWNWGAIFNNPNITIKDINFHHTPKRLLHHTTERLIYLKDMIDMKVFL